MKIKKRIIGAYHHAFAVQQSGLVAIFVSARCKSKEQIKSNTDEDLRVEINGVGFREIPAKKNTQQYNIPASFNGSELKGLKKTIVFFVMLKKGENVIDLIPRPSAFVEEIIVKELGSQRSIALPVNEQAEDGDRRPWFVFVLAYASIKSFSISANVQYRISDSDDIKIIIDNDIQKQEYSHYYRFWAFVGNLFKKLKQEKEQQEKTFAPNLPKARHYIEIWADGTPILDNVTLEIDPEFEPNDYPAKRIPTVDDPKWTGDFNDDTEQMILARLIFGEARSLSKKGKIAVGWSVRNRMEDPRWNDTYHGVILALHQYSAFEDEKNRPFIENPLLDEIQVGAWHECYAIAGQVISGETADPTGGANHYYSTFIDPPYWTKWKQTEFLIQINNTRFYNIHPGKNSGFVKIAFLLFIAAVLLVAGWRASIQIDNTRLTDSGGVVAGEQDVASKHFFINPQTEELFVMHFDEEGEVIDMKQLTYNGYPKSDVKALSMGERIGYFEMAHKRGEKHDLAIDSEREAFYNDYIRLMIKDSEDGAPHEVYRGDVHTARWELPDNKHVIVYRGCGTECLYAYKINIETKEVESEYQAY